LLLFTFLSPPVRTCIYRRGRSKGPWSASNRAIEICTKAGRRTGIVEPPSPQLPHSYTTGIVSDSKRTPAPVSQTRRSSCSESGRRIRDHEGKLRNLPSPDGTKPWILRGVVRPPVGGVAGVIMEALGRLMHLHFMTCLWTMASFELLDGPCSFGPTKQW
jgi:hypothetical protein